MTLEQRHHHSEFVHFSAPAKKRRKEGEGVACEVARRRKINASNKISIRAESGSWQRLPPLHTGRVSSAFSITLKKLQVSVSWKVAKERWQ
ncbi:hypothetical protein ZHAS_00017502 [Anopheles sinensis]|uniref:Uncharacterized protein n=1 Tax=Anopheles sinensis TaxID=74873 RepID=A0A084WGQ7_ANOSI|nr:hypothetical protein ZHAS_00017502 [Anopheles sinensis]